ncbi:hypothetical protein D3C87_2181570 [compost metagenome]
MPLRLITLSSRSQVTEPNSDQYSLTLIELADWISSLRSVKPYSGWAAICE